MNIEQKSQAYGVIQTLLVFIFAAAVFFGPEVPRLPTGRVSSIIGLAFCGLGIVLLFAAISRIGQSIQIAPEPKKGATLVTTGVYRWFRHPIYTAMVVLVIGLFLRRPTLAIALAGGAVIVFLIIKVRFEEKLLLATYAEYSAYRTRTWGIMPWPRRRAPR
ncbi:MAG: isoprenylcysteine carboxylmethyltransferase family protein [Terriglobales bacterium]